MPRSDGGRRLFVTVSFLRQEVHRDPVHQPGHVPVGPDGDLVIPRQDDGAARTFGEFDDALRHLLGGHRMEVAAQGGVFHGMLARVLAEFGLGGAGVDARNVDAERLHFAAQGVGKAAHAVFAGRVNGVGGRRDPARDRGHVDDVPASAFEHTGQDGVRNLDDAQQVDRDLHFDVALGGHVFEPGEPPETGVVEQDVYPAVDVKHGIHHDLDLFAVRHVHGDSESLPALSLDRGGQFLQTIYAPRGQDDATALVREQPRRVHAKSGGGAGDQDNFAFQFNRHREIPREGFVLRVPCSVFRIAYCVLRDAFA